MFFLITETCPIYLRGGGSTLIQSRFVSIHKSNLSAEEIKRNHFWMSNEGSLGKMTAELLLEEWAIGLAN